MHASEENYLKVIFVLQQQTPKGVKSADVAKKLNISPGAVSEMLKKLSEKNLLTHEPYKGVLLTKTGLRKGQNMVRRHRIWEMYLYQELGYPWHQVHDEAELLEHASSDALINILEEKLGFPRTDPHGDPIPSKTGKMPTLEKMWPLTQCDPGKSFKVARIVDFDQEFMNYMHSIQLTPLTEFELVDFRQFDQSYTIKLDQNSIQLSFVSAQHIFVTEGEKENEKMAKK